MVRPNKEYTNNFFIAVKAKAEVFWFDYFLFVLFYQFIII